MTIGETEEIFFAEVKQAVREADQWYKTMRERTKSIIKKKTHVLETIMSEAVKLPSGIDIKSIVLYTGEKLKFGSRF